MNKLPRRAIAKILAERSLGRAANLDKEVAAYLLSESRTTDLAPLMRDVMQYRVEQGIVEVVAVTAHALSDEVRSDIEKQAERVYPEAKKIIISEELQPDLVGGIRLEFPSEQLDLSVRASLHRFKQLTTAG